jgi:hypothetical protein
VDEFSAGRGKVLVALAFAAWIWLEVEKERPLFEVRVSFSDKALQRTQAAVVLGLKLVVHVSSPLCKRAKKKGGGLKAYRICNTRTNSSVLTLKAPCGRGWPFSATMEVTPMETSEGGTCLVKASSTGTAST